MRKLSFLLLSGALFLGVAAPALSHDYKAGEVRIDHPWTRATPPTANIAGGYMTLENQGTEADRLVGGSTPAAERVEIHSMSIVDDVMTMRQLPDGVDVPPGETVAFAPGSYHLMLIGLAKPLVEGERVPLTLEFANGGTLDVELAVDAMGSGGSADSHGGH